MSTDGKKRGRPEGSVQTPHTLLKIDLREQVRMNQRLRALLQKAVEELEAQLAREPNPQLALKIIETLGMGLASQGRALDSTAKHVLAGEEAAEEGNVDIMEILKGRGEG